MAAALRLAARGLGRVWPNPAVGCVIVNRDRVVGRGWTQPGGRPHAETEALRRAGDAARGATAYVTFEPCAHHGQTPPCADALVAAGVGRVVIACPDPDPRVAGRGVAILKAAGIEVAEGVMREAAEDLNQGFLTRLSADRPMVTLKIAASIDGRVATANGHSHWITAEPARRLGHLLRANHDAIAVGSGTVKADNPLLTCRLHGLEDATPVRVVFDGQLATSPDSQLVTTSDAVPTWLVTTGAAPKSNRKALGETDVEIIEVGGHRDGSIDIGDALETLAARGLTRMLVEGGPRLATVFLKAGLADRVAWFSAPIALGGDALPALGDLHIDRVDKAFRLVPDETMAIGNDILRMARIVHAETEE